MDLSQARVLITGGSSGIGLETGRLVREAGGQVVLNGRREDVLKKAASEIGATAVAGDVGVEADAKRIVSSAVESMGGLDTLINNAGWGRFGMLLDLDAEQFKSILDTNVLGAMFMARESARHFVGAGGGNIVNVSSTAGSKGFAGGTAYVASKFALGGMTECWRQELRKHDIRVMQINPSEVLTNFAASAGYDQKTSERKLQAVDIAHAIVGMLAMNDRGFTTELTVFATNPD